ncbi:MAG: type I phosphomannose isomerase catalytic subunit [Kiritimatiellia bacterium]|jgi:mannose-6-phosphate isomerase|nr:class I mannose-6-phosphate isomerase [Kiritimatiellia bacterium]MDD4173064.1 class I mannose-6-phosphate isomerase [Kiritimatiellia bacterium]MDD4441831.1 class I mannose-6-phosphate isomerase [Kiritimatiellia bacterium]MDX9792687.1 class I mannose-6-phosphate isomerase [Kiritimatiellia bacterium]NLC80925.1 mannose-6-phosphate isomerase [Lentisphaerota bacterium]
MSALCVPLVFKPVYKGYLWGGNRLAAVYGRTDVPEVCAESWEIAARPDGESVVAAGPFAGRGLTELAAAYGAALTGTRAHEPRRFPLLFKVIDARDRLSVQVHPHAENAGRTGGEPKTEMWVVLDRAPGASLYAGLAEGATPDSLHRALAEGTAAAQLVEMPVEPGQALFIPGGLVHAIGAGCLIYEVQQNSNTTYRLFDWNRVGADGQPRALHVEESFKTIDWSLPAPQMIASPDDAGEAGAGWSDVVACDYFSVRRLALTNPLDVAVDDSSFHALFVTAGAVTVSAGGERVLLRAGQSALVPADAGAYRLEPDAAARLLVTTL